MEGAAHIFGDALHVVDDLGILGERTEHVEEVELLEGLAVRVLAAGGRPTNITMGVESWCAMWTPIEEFVAPGPRVTKATPGRPVSLPCASAIIAVPPSWRQTMVLMRL